MTESKRVVCGRHGETQPTFTCRHVASGVACGFHAGVDDPAERWPDAWCDLCEEALQAAGGEWNAESEAQAAIKLLCTHCYEEARDLNRVVPPLARASGVRLTDVEASNLIHHAVHAAAAAQDASHARWGWRDMARWHFDHAASTLTFSDPGRPSVVADVRLVGSYSTQSGTFQWAWATFDERAPEAAAVSMLRVFGEVRGIARLTKPNWTCEEADGWRMASLAGYLLGTEGLYRAPFDDEYWWMLLDRWRAVN